MKPLTTEERLTRSIELGIIVDKEDEWLLSAYTWRISRGYVCTSFDEPPYYALLHHCIVGMPVYADEIIDHRNHVVLDNSRNNLRYKTSGENRVNAHDYHNPYKNIEQRPNGLYRVRLKRNGRYHDAPYLYTTLEAAQHARDTMRKEMDDVD